MLRDTHKNPFHGHQKHIRKCSKIKDLDINKHFKHRKVNCPKGKHVSSGLKEYQKQF